MLELIGEITAGFESETFTLDDGRRLTGGQLMAMGYTYDSIRFDMLANYLRDAGYESRIYDAIGGALEGTLFNPTIIEFKMFVVMLCYHLNMMPEIIISHV